MNRGELIDKVANERECTKAEAKRIIGCILKNVTDSLAKGDAVGLVGFGTFGIRKRAARVARNPQTGGKVSVPAKNVPFFRAGKELKERVK